jgi:hypothetical protein
MRVRIGAALAAVVVVVLLVGTGLGWFGSGSSVTGATRPLGVRTSLTPTSIFYGDPVVAHVAVDVDTRTVSPDSVGVAPGFSPFSQTGPAQVTRSTAGDEETIDYRYTLQCTTDNCLPVGPKAKSVQFPPVIVSATIDGKQVKKTAAWPALPVSSRLSPADLAGTPKYRHADVPPPARFGVSPVVADLLTVAGGLLGLAALVLVGIELAAYLARRRRLREARLSPLEQAVAYAREAAGRPDAADRRKALDLLSRVLDDTGDGTLADTTGGVAWSEEAPSPERTLELADEVEA